MERERGPGTRRNEGGGTGTGIVMVTGCKIVPANVNAIYKPCDLYKYSSRLSVAGGMDGESGRSRTRVLGDTSS